MSQAPEVGVSQVEVDPYEIGWYLESADEEIYGPVSRQTLSEWLVEQAITPDTLVRHCTQAESRPLADQESLRDHLHFQPGAAAVVDRLPEVWPRPWRERLALAEGTNPCFKHKRPATLVCVRCHAPYCSKCQMRPLKKQFYFCRQCQGSNHNRRLLAVWADMIVFILIPSMLCGGVLGATGAMEQYAWIFMLVYLGGILMLFFRDSLFGGASPGKRLVGLRVVKAEDGVTPLSVGQGIVRWLSQLIPYFNIYDIVVVYRDPRLRRMGDRWAKTRVVDSVAKLGKAREKIARRLLKKGYQPPREVGMTMDDYARIP